MNLSLLKPADLGFVYNGDKNKFSKEVAVFMKSTKSHTFMYIGCWFGVHLVIETSDVQIIINRLDRYLDGRDIEIFSPIHLSDEQRHMIVVRAFMMLEKYYGYAKFLWMGVRRIFMNYLKIKFPMLFKDQSVCCDVPMKAYQFEWSPLYGVMHIDTEELYQYVKNSDAFAKVL